MTGARAKRENAPSIKTELQEKAIEELVIL